MSLDLFFFNLINGFAGRWHFLDFLGIFFAKYLAYIFAGAVVLFVVADYKKFLKPAIIAGLAGLLARFFTALIHIFYFSPRPFVNFKVNQILDHANRSSFPSSHASVAFAIATIIYFFNKKLGWIGFALAFLISVSRVFVGIHWPSDILAGAVLGVAVGWILNVLLVKYANKIIKEYKAYRARI